MACTVKVQDAEVLIFNIYNQPQTFLGFEALETSLRHLLIHILQLLTIVMTNSNLH